MHSVVYGMQNFRQNVVIVLGGYPKNQQQKTMHTNPNYNLLELKINQERRVPK